VSLHAAVTTPFQCECYGNLPFFNCNSQPGRNIQIQTFLAWSFQSTSVQFCPFVSDERPRHPAQPHPVASSKAVCSSPKGVLRSIKIPSAVRCFCAFRDRRAVVHRAGSMWQKQLLPPLSCKYQVMFPGVLAAVCVCLAAEPPMF